MTADEARKLADKVDKQPKIDKALYKEAVAEIKEAANKGEYHCHVRLYDFRSKTEAIKKKLELDGYAVSYKYEEPCMIGGRLELDESAVLLISWYPKDYVKGGK